MRNREVNLNSTVMFKTFVIIFLFISFITIDYHTPAQNNGAGVSFFDRIPGMNSGGDELVSYDVAEKRRQEAYDDLVKAVAYDKLDEVSSLLKIYISESQNYFKAIGTRPDFKILQTIDLPGISAGKIWSLDVDNDGINEIILSTLDGLAIGTLNGSVFEVDHRLSLSEQIEGVTVADIDNDKNIELIITTRAEIINTKVDDKDIQILWRGPNKMSATTMYTLQLAGDDRPQIYARTLKPGRRVFRLDTIIARIGWYFGDYRDERVLLDITDLGYDFFPAQLNSEGFPEILITPPLETDKPRLRAYESKEMSAEPLWAPEIPDTTSIMAMNILRTEKGLELIVGESTGIRSFVLDEKSRSLKKGRKQFPISSLSDIAIDHSDSSSPVIIVLTPRRRLFILKPLDYDS